MEFANVFDLISLVVIFAGDGCCDLQPAHELCFLIVRIWLGVTADVVAVTWELYEPGNMTFDVVLHKPLSLVGLIGFTEVLFLLTIFFSFCNDMKNLFHKRRNVIVLFKLFSTINSAIIFDISYYTPAQERSSSMYALMVFAGLDGLANLGELTVGLIRCCNCCEEERKYKYRYSQLYEL